MAINRTEEYTEEADEFSSEAINARPRQSTSNDAIQSGWDAAEKLTRQPKTYAKEFRFSDTNLQIVKFLDESGPFAVFRQHWLKKEGQKSYICIGTNCPLCVKLGDRASDKRALSVANLSAEEGFQRQMLIASPRIWTSLHGAHFSKNGPLTNNYWSLGKAGEAPATTFSVSPVKGRDLTEDWNINEAEAEAAIAEMKPFTRDDLRSASREELDAVADALL